MKVLKDNSLEPSVRMFDGCMVEGDHYDNPDIITKIETYINNKWKDLNGVHKLNMLAGQTRGGGYVPTSSYLRISE